MSKTEVIYGINPVGELISSGRRKMSRFWLCKGTEKNPRLQRLAAALERRDIPSEWVDKGRLIHIANTRDHQGIAVECEAYPYVQFDAIADESRLLLLDNIEDPHNMGAILRSAEIFGFKNILLPMRGVPEIYPSVVKVSAGATEYLQITRSANANQYIKRLQQRNCRIVALDGGGKTPMEELSTDWEGPLCLVIGGENKSVGQFILNTAEYVVRISQQGKINSLNASVAAGVAMHAFSQSS